MTGSLTASADEATPLDAEKHPESSSDNDLLLLVIGVVLAAVVVSSILSHVGVLAVFALLLGIGLWRTIPTEESFDARKELKRVKRGKHLPDGHRDKPKSWAEKKLKNIQTAVTTGLTEAVNGYDVKFESLGICKLAIVRDLTTGEVCCWAGVLGKWRFELGQKLLGLAVQLNKTKRDVAATTHGQQIVV